MGTIEDEDGRETCSKRALMETRCLVWNVLVWMVRVIGIVMKIIVIMIVIITA